jgi:hypothetical protein
MGQIGAWGKEVGALTFLSVLLVLIGPIRPISPIFPSPEHRQLGARRQTHALPLGGPLRAPAPVASGPLDPALR